MGEQTNRELISLQSVSDAKNIYMVPLYQPHLTLTVMISPMTYSIEKHFLAFLTFLPIILLEYQTA